MCNNKKPTYEKRKRLPIMATSFFMSIWGGRMRYAPTNFVNIMLNVIPIIILCRVSTDIERSRDAAPSELGSWSILPSSFGELFPERSRRGVEPNPGSKAISYVYLAIFLNFPKTPKGNFGPAVACRYSSPISRFSTFGKEVLIRFSTITEEKPRE